LITRDRKPQSQTDSSDARALVRELGCHALAVDVAGGALRSMTFAEFATSLADASEDALEFAASLPGVLPNDHQKSVAATLLRSIDSLNEPARDFLRLASVLGPGPIPRPLAEAVFRETDHLGHGAATQVAVLAFADIDAHSLAERPESIPEARAVHALVCRAIRFRDGKPERSDILRKAGITILRRRFFKPPGDALFYDKSIEFEMAQARYLSFAASTLDEAALLGLVASYDYSHGAFESAITLWDRQVKALEHLFGPESRGTFTPLNNIACALLQLGKLEEARRQALRVLEVSRRVLPPGDPDIIQNLQTLASTLALTGDFGILESCMNRSSTSFEGSKALAILRRCSR